MIRWRFRSWLVLGFAVACAPSSSSTAVATPAQAEGDASSALVEAHNRLRKKHCAPPLRWSYRGLGETVIGLSYGPWMVLGSLYLHAGALSWAAFAASLVPGLWVTALAVVQAV